MLVYIGFGLLLYFLQDNFLYYLTPETTDNKYHSFRLQSGSASLKIWQINPAREPAIIYFGGNGEDAYISLQQLELIFPDYTVYVVNYRGYGGSTGSPTEEGLLKDATAIYDEIKIKHQSVSAIGRSLGSGIAIHLAAHREISKLALVTPYDSITNVAQQAYPVYPVSWLLRSSYDSLDLAGKVSSQQILILIAEQDKIIPPVHAYKLAAAFSPSRLTNITIANAGHNSISASKDYPYHLSHFFNANK